MLSTPNTSNTPSIQSISRASLSTEDLNKFNTEENVRRVIEDERRSDVEEAKKDEMQRRIIFDEKIQLMKDEHQVFLKLNYPNVVGQKQIKDADIENIVASVNLRKKEIEKKESELKEKVIDRLNREKRRKIKESKLKINKVKTSQRFFESEVEKELWKDQSRILVLIQSLTQMIYLLSKKERLKQYKISGFKKLV